MTSGQMKNVLRVEEIGQAIDEVRELAKDQGVHIALAGGVAMQLYGSPRFTKDVDFLLDDELTTGLKRGKPLSFGGYQAKTATGVPVDLIVRDDDYADLYLEALVRAVRLKGVPIPVVSPEYMAVLKLASGRGKDLDDLRYLLVEYDGFNYKRARKIAHDELGFHVANELDSYLKEIQIAQQLERGGHAPAPRRRR